MEHHEVVPSRDEGDPVRVLRGERVTTHDTNLHITTHMKLIDKF